ncbi:hypothetical protein, partial [Klebsiella pneumoniae]|uniref:hypothetical protein n=1 Tax=Klebsiella pneumoniae TaxID=573 RepID=UPI0030138660
EVFLPLDWFGKLAYLSTNDLNHSFPNVVVDLLQDYEDVFPDDLPQVLPPLRGIEHQIDFVSGVVTPNRPAYRSNPCHAPNPRLSGA